MLSPVNPGLSVFTRTLICQEVFVLFCFKILIVWQKKVGGGFVKTFGTILHGTFGRIFGIKKSTEGSPFSPQGVPQTRNCGV